MWLSRVVGDQIVLGVTKDRGAHPIGQLARIDQSEKKGYDFIMIFKILLWYFGFYYDILDFMVIFWILWWHFMIAGPGRGEEVRQWLQEHREVAHFCSLLLTFVHFCSLLLTFADFCSLLLLLFHHHHYNDYDDNNPDDKQKGDQVHHIGRWAQGELRKQPLQGSEASSQFSGKFFLKLNIIIITITNTNTTDNHQAKSGNADNNSHERDRLHWLPRPWLDESPCGASCPLF